MERGERRKGVGACGPRGFLRFLGLTAPLAPRVVVAADAASKKGHGFAVGCGLLTQSGGVEGL